MAEPNFDTLKPTIAFVGQTGDEAQAESLRNTFAKATDETLLRRVAAEIRRAQSTSKDADRLKLLDSLLTTAEQRRNSLVALREQAEEARKVVHDESFSDKLNAEIEFVAATTDQATLDRLLQRIESTDDLQALQKAVKKLAAVRADLKLSPTGAEFQRKKLSASDWRNKLRQIEVAIETQILNLRKARIAAAAAVPVTPETAPSEVSPVAEFFAKYWWVIALSTLALFLLVGLVIYFVTQKKAGDKSSSTTTTTATSKQSSGVRPFIPSQVPRYGPVPQF